MSSLLAFFAIAFGVTWTCWIAVITIPVAGPLRTALTLAGVFAPSLAALVVTAWTEGRPGTRALIGRIFRWDVPARWYVFAVSYFAAAKLAAAVVHRALTGSWPTFGQTPLLLIPFAIIISTPVQSGEEIGWRGYALPRLAARMGYASASILLGVIWACWHLPQFYLPGEDTAGQSFPIWAVQVIAVSVAIAWLYAKSNGSLLLTMIMHSAINQTSGIVSGALPNANNVLSMQASPVAYITAVLLWIAAGYFIWRMPKPEEPFTRRPWRSSLKARTVHG
jgi:membrane protease YdiL (CAAX protease family)